MARQTAENPLIWKPEKVADELGLATSKVRQMLYSGELPGFKVGKRWLVPVKALEDWVKKQASGQ